MPPQGKHSRSSDKPQLSSKGHNQRSVAQSSANVSQWTPLPVDLQQTLLNIFRDTFSEDYNSNLPAAIQQVKQHLFNRDFSNAFDQEHLRQAYAIRWSPSRALAYAHVFYNLSPLTTRLFSRPEITAVKPHGDLVNRQMAAAHVQEYSTGARHPSANAENVPGTTCRIVCIGAGAGAEIIAFGGFLRALKSTSISSGKPTSRVDVHDETFPGLQIGIRAIDIADWSSIANKLHGRIITASSLSQYASAEAQAANVPLIGPNIFGLDFVKQDVLNIAIDQMPTLFADATLVTLMFTLNELYSTSMSATTNLLLSLTMLLSPGAIMLVVDSPGSYSTVNLGKANEPGNENPGTKYPMQWLLDHTLLESAAVGSSKNASRDRRWEKLESRDSEWFRLAKELRYPIELEDMRYQVHLYRRL